MTRLHLARLGLRLVPAGFVALTLLQSLRWDLDSAAAGRAWIDSRDCLVLNHGDSVSSVGFSSDGQFLATAGGVLLDSGDLKVWDWTRGQQRAAFRTQRRWISSVAFAGDDGTVLSANHRAAYRCRCVAPDVLERLATLSQEPAKVAVAPGGRALAYSTAEGRLVLVELPSGHERIVWNEPDGGCFSVTFSADGRSLAAVGRAQVAVWDLPSGRERFRERRPDEFGTHAVALSPDGRTLAHITDGIQVRVVDVPSGRELALCCGHTDWAVALAFAPDGRTFASAGRDGSVFLWDVDGRRRASLEGHTDVVNCLAFSPDGRRLASGSDDQTVRLWPIDADRQPLLVEKQQRREVH